MKDTKSQFQLLENDNQNTVSLPKDFDEGDPGFRDNSIVSMKNRESRINLPLVNK
jgi:hypothetical protein